MSDDEREVSADAGGEEGINEIIAKLQEETQKRKEANEKELEEYLEIRKNEIEQEEKELDELRERRAKRKQEREEEEKRTAGLRAEEEARRRAEDEERQRKKREEDERKREERERKRAEFTKMANANNRPNFIISKKSASNVESAPEESKPEEVQKSKEQLEAERKAILEQRIQPLNISGLSGDALKQEAKRIHDLITKLEGDKYDLEQRFTRQSYDMQELAERARQMAKGEKKSTKVQSAENDPLAAKFHGCPNKVIMFSTYERVKDHRSFSDRKNLYTGPLYVESYERISPKTNLVMTEEGFQVKEAGAEPAAAPAPVEEAPAPAEEVAAE